MTLPHLYSIVSIYQSLYLRSVYSIPPPHLFHHFILYCTNCHTLRTKGNPRFSHHNVQKVRHNPSSDNSFHNVAYYLEYSQLCLHPLSLRSLQGSWQRLEIKVGHISQSFIKKSQTLTLISSNISCFSFSNGPINPNLSLRDPRRLQ